MSYLTKLFKSIDLIKQELDTFAERIAKLPRLVPAAAGQESLVCRQTYEELLQYRVKYIDILLPDMEVLLSKKMTAKDEVTGDNRYKPVIIAKATEYHRLYFEFVRRCEELIEALRTIADGEARHNSCIKEAHAASQKEETARQEELLRMAEAAEADSLHKRAEAEVAERQRLADLHDSAAKIRKLNEDQAKLKVKFVERLLAAIAECIHRYGELFAHDLSLPLAPRVDRLKGNLTVLEEHCQSSQQYKAAVVTLGNMLSQVINNPENQQLRFVNGENRQLVERLLRIGYSSSDEGGGYVALGLHCLLSIGFSVSRHGAVPSLLQHLHRLKQAAATPGATAEIETDIGTGELETVFTVATASEVDLSGSVDKYNWDVIIDQHYDAKDGLHVVMQRYIDHGWQLGVEGIDVSAFLVTRESVGSSAGTGNSFPLHSFQFTFLPEPNPESGREEDLERWSLWYNSLSAYSECFA